MPVAGILLFNPRGPLTIDRKVQPKKRSILNILYISSSPMTDARIRNQDSDAIRDRRWDSFVFEKNVASVSGSRYSIESSCHNFCSHLARSLFFRMFLLLHYPPFSGDDFCSSYFRNHTPLADGVFLIFRENVGRCRRSCSVPFYSWFDTRSQRVLCRRSSLHDAYLCVISNLLPSTTYHPSQQNAHAFYYFSPFHYLKRTE